MPVTMNCEQNHSGADDSSAAICARAESWTQFAYLWLQPVLRRLASHRRAFSYVEPALNTAGQISIAEKLREGRWTLLGFSTAAAAPSSGRSEPCFGL